jgi:WD40 repeat protein
LRRAADGEFLGKLDWTGWLPHQAAFSPDGTVLAGGLRSRSSQPALVALWQVSDWTLFRVLEDFSDDLMVNELIFTPDGTTLIAGAPDGIVRLWQVKEGSVTPVQTFNGYHAALSPDGQFLATTQSDGTIQILQPFGGDLLHTLTGHEPQTNTVAFSPDGALLASGGRDNTIRLWDVASGTLLDTLEGHTNHVQSVAFSPDGDLLASGSQDSTVRLWNVADGTLLNTLDDHTTTVWTVAWSPDGTTLASGSHDGTAKVWQVQTE